jgi:SAM-dependent methyltransferase
MKSQSRRSLHDWASAYYTRSRAYANRMGDKWDARWQAHFLPYVRTVQAHAGERGRVLDVGCGGGQTAALIAEAVRDVVGIDLNRLGYLRGRRHQPRNVRFIQGSALTLPLASASFDVIGSYATLEHLPDVDLAFREMLRVLRPGGWLVLFAPNIISPVRVASLFLRGARKGRWHPDARPSFLLHALCLNLLKALKLNRTFSYRSPHVHDLSFPGSDYDAICLVNPFDLSRIAARHGLQVAALAQGTSRYGRWVAARLPWIAGGIGLVARKPPDGIPT